MSESEDESELIAEEKSAPAESNNHTENSTEKNNLHGPFKSAPIKSFSFKRPDHSFNSAGPPSKKSNSSIFGPILSSSSTRIRSKLRPNQILDSKYQKVWQKVIPFLSHRDKYCLYNTSPLFRTDHRDELTQVAQTEIERLARNLFRPDGNREFARSYVSPHWAFYRAFLWINEQSYHSKWAQWKYFFRERRHPSNMAILSKCELMSEMILSEQIALAPPDVEVFFNRPIIPPRDLTENSDWFISYDTYTDQILVLDLATGWSDIQRQTYSLHDDSPDYGVQNLNNLRDGILLKDGEFLVFNNIMNGTRLNLVNLEEERVRKIESNFNSLFLQTRLQLPLMETVKKSVQNGKRIYANPSKDILLAVNALTVDLWRTFKVIRIKVEDFVSDKAGVLDVDCLYVLKSDNETYPMMLSFLTSFRIASDDQVRVADIKFCGFKKKIAC